MVRPRVAEEAPVRVKLHAAQRHVRGGGHVRDVQPHGDVGQRGALDLVQRARVAQAQGVVDHVVLRRPRVDRQASALVRSNHHVVVVHAQDGGAHAVDEPDGLVEVLGQDHPRAREEGRLERRLGHELAADVVVHVALGVGRRNGERSAVAEEGLRGEAVQAGANAAADGEECRLRRLCQDVVTSSSVGISFPLGRARAPCVPSRWLSAAAARACRSAAAPEDRALAADHLVEVPLLDLHVMPLRRVQRWLHAGQLVEVADKHQGRDPLRRAPLSDEPLEKLPAQLAHLLYDDQVVGPHDLQRLVDAPRSAACRMASWTAVDLPLPAGPRTAKAGGGLFERVVLGFVPGLPFPGVLPRLPLPQPLADRLQDLFRDPRLLPRQFGRPSARLRRRLVFVFVELAVEVALDQALVREQHGRDVQHGKLLCASCSVRAALRKLLCLSRSAQVALRESRFSTRRAGYWRSPRETWLPEKSNMHCVLLLGFPERGETYLGFSN